MSNAVLIIALLCYLAAAALSKHGDLGPAALLMLAAIAMHAMAHRTTYRRFRRHLALKHASVEDLAKLFCQR